MFLTSHDKVLWRFSPVTLALAILLMVGCDMTSTSNAEPSRPDGVPSEAIWTGGKDGGVYVLIRQNEEEARHIYNGTIYAEGSGVVWYEGRFALEPPSETDFDLLNSETYGAWDGDTLYLRDGHALHTLD